VEIGKNFMQKLEILDRALGCLIGSAVGDALGAPVEFMRPGTFEPVSVYRAGGPFKLRAGEWTDDTAMALGLAEALIVDPDLGSDLVYQNWLAWYREGEFIPAGTCFDIGSQTSAALSAFAAGRSIEATQSAGNGGIMRLAPIATRWWFTPYECAHMAAKQSNLTHNNVDCSHIAGSLGYDLADLIARGPAASQDWPQITGPVENTGYVRHTIHNAMWAYTSQPDFESAVLVAVNLGHDSDTVGAVAGAIAGAAYGLSQIPTRLVQGLLWVDRLKTVAEALWDASLAAQTSTVPENFEKAGGFIGEGDAIFADEVGPEEFARFKEEMAVVWRKQGLNPSIMADPRFGGN
jgi:ADP-ribosyl-[dinitrogen reductase] hydrolase